MDDELTADGAAGAAADAAREAEEERKWREKRAYVRSSVLWPATLVFGAKSRDCIVNNLSANGAKLQVDETGDLPKELVLRLPKFGDFNARVAWRRGTSLGLQFLDDPQQVAELLAPTLPAIASRE